MNRGLAWVVLMAAALLAFGLLVDDTPSPPSGRQVPGASVATNGLAEQTVDGDTSMRVAVLPFIPISSGRDDEYLAIGFSQEVLRMLQQYPTLPLAARGSSFRFSGSGQSNEAGTALGVSHVISGEVHRAGDRLRIQAQLLHVGDDTSITLLQRDGRESEASALAAEIAQVAAASLDLTPLRPRGNGIAATAMSEFEKGQVLFARAHGAGDMISLLRQANVHFERAIELAPHFSRAQVAAADLFIHILLKSANGQLDGNITSGDREGAIYQLQRFYDGAIRPADGSRHRSTAQVDRAVLLADTRSLGRLTQQTLSAQGCITPDWGHLVAAPFGSAQALGLTFNRMTRCDPLSSHSWSNLAWAQLWSGKLAATVDTARRGAVKADSAWLREAWLIALLHTGRSEEARNLVGGMKPARGRSYADFLLVASSGDAAAATERQQKYLASFGPNDRLALVMHALRGNRNEANRLAAEIDARHGGHLGLLNAIFQCACGAPFDLDSTPRFSAMIAASGLQWPPGRPVDWPLKKW